MLSDEKLKMYPNLLEIATIRCLVCQQSFSSFACLLSLQGSTNSLFSNERSPLHVKELALCYKFQSTLWRHPTSAISALCCFSRCSPADTGKSPTFSPSPGRTRFESNQPHSRCRIGRAHRRGLRAGLPGSTARNRFRNRGDHPPARGWVLKWVDETAFAKILHHRASPRTSFSPHAYFYLPKNCFGIPPF
jgi:hypothetical protein